MMLSLDEARQRIQNALTVLPAVERSFTEALGHVLAEPIVADVDLPPWANSSMDGFAVRAEDLAGTTPGSPTRLRVVGDLPAGRAPSRAIGTGEAIRIMTGAPLPSGGDAVAIVETTRMEGDDVLITEPVRAGANIRRAGEDVSRGSTVLPAGHLVRAADVGLLASLGRTRVRVIRKPVVAVLSSGDELVPPDQTPGPGQIRDSNRFTLTAHLAGLGFTAIDCGNALDRQADLEALFRKAAAVADVVVSTGGVSVGDHDLTKIVLARLGTMNFWRVAIRPGKPLAFGFIEGKPVFGLPGNPVSSLVVLDQIVRPALRHMAGQVRLDREVWTACLEEPIKRSPGRTEFIRAVIRWEDGRFKAKTTGPQGSGMLSSLSRANGFLIVPAEVSDIPAGATVLCQLFLEEI
ncbi:MAG: molybdopterin molybdotransferase MoeA [Candidatus Eisenbacteria bacterium]|nr:molybdopterin molybdotransferase MoeA [Candidatus Eisenbacteria bacterium]